MKVRLLKLFCNHTPGHIMTMHPINAHKYAQAGICEALTDEEQVYLDRVIKGRRKVVETQIRSKATETATMTPKMSKKSRKPRKPRDKVAKRIKS